MSRTRGNGAPGATARVGIPGLSGKNGAVCPFGPLPPAEILRRTLAGLGVDKPATLDIGSETFAVAIPGVPDLAGRHRRFSLDWLPAWRLATAERLPGWRLPEIHTTASGSGDVSFQAELPFLLGASRRFEAWTRRWVDKDAPGWRRCKLVLDFAGTPDATRHEEEVETYVVLPSSVWGSHHLLTMDVEFLREAATLRRLILPWMGAESKCSMEILVEAGSRHERLEDEILLSGPSSFLHSPWTP